MKCMLLKTCQKPVSVKWSGFKEVTTGKVHLASLSVKPTSEHYQTSQISFRHCSFLPGLKRTLLPFLLALRTNLNSFKCFLYFIKSDNNQPFPSVDYQQLRLPIYLHLSIPSFLRGACISNEAVKPLLITSCQSTSHYLQIQPAGLGGFACFHRVTRQRLELTTPKYIRNSHQNKNYLPSSQFPILFRLLFKPRYNELFGSSPVLLYFHSKQKSVETPVMAKLHTKLQCL